MKIISKPTNECFVKVEPRYAGNYGCIRVSGEKRTAKREYQLCTDIIENINRHVDDVERASIEQIYNWVDETNNEFESLYEALEYHFVPEDYFQPCFTYSYTSLSGKISCSSSVDNYKKLIEKAYLYPNEFEVKHGKELLSKLELEFLQNVIEDSIKNQNKREEV